MGKKKKVKELEEFTLDFLRRHKKFDVTRDMLHTAMIHATGADGRTLNKTIEKLIRNEVIQEDNKGNLVLVVETTKRASNEGVIDINRHGTGFVTVEGYESDIRINRKRLGLALPGDTVTIRITGKDNRGRLEGKVLDIVKRGRSLYVGTFRQETRKSYVIEPDEKSAHIPFFVHPKNTKNAKTNDKVVFQLMEWVHPKYLPEAEVVDVLGEKGSNDAEILSILADNQLKSTFSKEAEDFCEKISWDVPEAEVKKRKDLRKELVFTIDPVDAKDFDDALSLSMMDNGNYYLGVHIADVTHYMQRGIPLDDEARDRATSVYLVDRVIPMLPEKLSNGVCSLRPKEDKLTYSCFMEVTPDGQVVDYSIDETVIHSKFRLTYEEAQEIIEGKKHKQLSDPIQKLVKLTDTLTEKRFRENAIDLHTPEPRFVLDDEGKPVDVIVKKQLKAHRLIEECMLLANRTVAEHIDAMRKNSGKKKDKELFPFFYRIHDKPNMERLGQVAEMLGTVGIQFKVNKNNIGARQINEVLEQVKGKSMEYTINDLILRSMAKAEYSPQNIGHFGLGFRHYAHFTSPIRRYPDVIVHRLLKKYSSSLPSYKYSDLKDLGTHCSEREKMAVTAERASIKLKQVEYMSSRIGEIFEGVVSGVTENGIYVLLKDNYCEGMIRISDLDDDYYIYDEKRHCLTGRNRGRTYILGSELKVKVVSTNPELRQIDFQLAN